MKDKRANRKFLQVLENSSKEIKPHLAYAKRNKPEKMVPIKVAKETHDDETTNHDKTLERAPSQASGMTHMTGATEMAT